MESYNLFGDDGSGMLEGLTDLGGADTFAGTSASGVAGDNKETSDNTYRQTYNPSGVTQEGSLQKLTSFGGGGASGIPSSSQPVPNPGSGPPAPEYHEYGNYPPRPRLPQPPHAPLHPTHHVHPSHAYPGYHPGPDPMYGMPEHPGIGDMSVWSGAPGPNRYTPITPSYRHSYDHQQKIHQYPPQQGSGIGLQAQNGAYLPRQPHFPQPPSQQVYGQQQNYPNYTQMHPPNASRISQHPSYHQQMDVNPHQYGLPHSQQHASIPQHQQHQGMSSHGSGLQGHHLHHGAGTPLHHVPRQPLAPASAATSHAVPSQMPYGSPHHSVSMNYQHQVQHPLDVNVSSQYGSAKPSALETGSPQYRPPFPQLSPQMSPRAQISPRQQQQSQLSPRPTMSPVKGPIASPHGPRNVSQTQASSGNSSVATFQSQNTLQALEQMVLPAGAEYPYQRNPASPAVSHISSPSQWNQNKLPTPHVSQNIDNSEQSSIKNTDTAGPAVQAMKPDAVSQVQKIAGSDNKSSEIIKDEKERTNESIPTLPNFIPQVNNNSGTTDESIKMTSNTEILQSNVTKTPIVDTEKSSNSETNTSEINDSKNLENVRTISDSQNQLKDLPESINKCGDQPTQQSQSAIPSLIPNINISSIEATEIKSLEGISHSPLNTVSNNNKFGAASPMTINRNQGYSVNNLQTAPITLPPTVTQSNLQNLAVPSNVPANTAHNIVPTYGSGPAVGSQTLPPIPPSHSIPQNLPNVMQVHNTQSTLPCLTSTIQSLPGNVQGAMPGIQNLPQNPSSISNVHGGMPVGPQTMHPTMGQPLSIPNPNNPTNLVPHNPNVIMMGANPLPHTNISGMYGIPHHQERSSIQQQIQEIYCLPPSNENQEKVRCLQERLALLQQHETNDKCNGGPNCLIQNPVYGSKMVESPQVTSTTGRGRGKGPAKPRKPRTKKEKVPVTLQSLDQLPVSEDCVTAGTGVQNNSELDLELSEDITNLDNSTTSIDELNGIKGKKRGPRKTKERKPRARKEPKLLEGDKPIKERKKREPRDPNAPKKKRTIKKDIIDVQADTTTNYEIDKIGEIKSNISQINSSIISTDSQNLSEVPGLEDSNVTDFDDIPVSKIAIKDLLEEAEAKREQTDKEDDNDSLFGIKRKSSKKRSSIPGSSKKNPIRKSVGGKRKRRGGLVPDSDGEPDDMMSTPPPSPPPEGDDSLKRRSARNTQRKKYTDDVILRLSDDEYPLMSNSKQDKEHKLDDLSLDMKEVAKLDGLPKPNYIYVNTSEEDSMIVQLVIQSRMGKRELKNEPVSVKEITDNTEKDQISNETAVLEIKVENESSPNETKTSTEESTLMENAVASNIDIENDNESKHDVTDEIKTEPVTETTTENKTTTEVLDNDDSKNKKIIVDVEEYFVKYRNFSYLHCEWKTEDELYKGDKRISSKIKRFKQKQAQQTNIFELLDEEPFNPDYTEVERILDMSENQDPANDTVVKHYLVKWKSLQYEDSTWELEENVDVDKIKQYKIFSEIPPKEKWKYKRRPSADNWVQLKESPLYKGGNNLRPYQLEGLNWLLFSWHNSRNCILADEMGLGKTIQSLTFVNTVWECGIRGPFLIIAPLSTIPNWQREFEGWTEMNVVVYHGSQQSKSMIQEYEFYYKNEKGEPIKEITKFNVLITTFEIIVTDFQELKLFNWRICVIDEAHRLKNRNCKLLEGLRQLHLEHRVLLSGTPLQNNVNELFSLLNFLEPSQFSSCDAFLSEFGQLKSESEVLKLQALLKPMMLRRLKEDVEKTLAPKEETIIEVELTNIQKKYYRAILERNFSFLQKGTTSAANIPNLMNTMMELRKCCIHPYLLNGAEDQIQYDYKQANGEDKEAYYKALIQSSGKMVLVDKLLPKLKAGGHRVLIFSQMVKCLDILEDYLLYRKYPFERIDGRIRGNLRQEAIDRFSKPDSDRFVFLLCTKAGGLGINLTAADTVIIYDSDWNPQNDLQAQARCHRIGQQKMVKIYRLICRNSYEREMFDKASLKLGLDKAILQSMNTSQGKEAGPKQLSKKEIEDLLKKGAYGAVMDEDNAGDKFCEEDIEMILARRTQVIQMESEKGSTFSKASFAAADQRSDIDIRDPDFWNKWAKKAEIDTTEKKEDEDLIVTEPRKRNVIKRYGHDDGPMEMSDMEATPDSEEDEEGVSLRSKRKKDKFGKKGRKYASDDYIPRHEGFNIEDEVVYGSWTRSECFKIERGLLTFGWGRWDEILDKNQFRKGWTIPVIEDCARVIVLYCLRNYKGDEKIRNFIWDLIEPCENGEVTISRNHSGLHNPVPRGRNAKKKNRPKDIPKSSDLQKWEDTGHWCSNDKYDCEAYLESSYKKHLYRHANKVLLRVRMMYYIKHEVIGDYATILENGTHASSLGMRVPRGVDSTPPRLWWDSECDVSLLAGTYLHGYENYLAMRSDPQLCFVDKLGPPDDAECTDIKSEERLIRGAEGEDCTDEVSSGAGATSPGASRAASPSAGLPTGVWPSLQDLNTRLRRLITAYQRNYKREELKLQQRAKVERRTRLEASREEAAWRWSRADEEAFRRTVASYGVEFDPATKSLRWGRFRALARLDNKTDDALTDYLKAFMAMCKRQCGLSVGEAELPTRADLKAEPIGEERAIATLERIDLLRVLREEVAPAAALEARLAAEARLAPSERALPWWQPAAHDKLLVLAVCKHGLGDTYQKIFLDPKLPFADCARKWASKNKHLLSKDSKETSEDEEKTDEEPTSEGRMSLRRSKRTHAGDVEDEDGDALSELESLARLGRSTRPPGPELWFSERALETRLHHIAHAVQNAPEPPQPAKRHIAIDVETERAKLHALLSAPSEQPQPPPPAHQRPAAPTADVAPVDLSTPLDLSADPAVDAGPDSDPPAAAPRSRLDDTLNRLMKRKNVPAPEQIVGKEKKRKKLDEIVLGLSAARNSGSRATTSEVSVTPARSTPAPPAHKPFSVTLTSVPSPQPSSSREPASFLQQSLEQSSRTSATKPSNTPPLKSYSHEAKVNKWLAEQTSRRAQPPPPRLAPDEHVPVVHRVTGKRLTGHKAPQLKHLAQWIAENPMYDIDAKWTEGIKEHVKLPQDVRAPRHSSMQVSTSTGERKKGRPPTLDTNSTNVLSSGSHLNQNLSGLNPALLASLSSLSAFDPKTLAATLSNLSGFDPKLLGSFDPKLLTSLGSFDPKTNPLLNSFSSMPNLLGNMAGGNIFANLAGLGLPGFPSLDMNSLSGANAAGDSKNKTRKPESGGASSSSKSNSQFPFVFPNPNMLYPQLGLSGLNPFGMHSGLSSAYDALGLLSNNLSVSSGASTLHSSSHSSARTSSKTTTPRSSTVVTSSSASRPSKTPDRQQSAQLPQILLPPDPHLLESLSKQSINYEAVMKSEKRSRDADCHDSTKATDLSKSDKKKYPFEALRNQMPPEFAAVQEKLLKGDKKDLDISKMLLEQMASGALSASLVSSTEAKKLKESEKDAYEKLSKSSSEYIARTLSSEDGTQNLSAGHKRQHDDMSNNEPQNLAMPPSDTNPSKKIKEAPVDTKDKHPDHSAHGEMDLEDLIAPSTVIKTGVKASDFENNITKINTDSVASGSNIDRAEKPPSMYEEPTIQSCKGDLLHSNINIKDTDNKDSSMNLDDTSLEDASSNDCNRKVGNKRRGRKTSEENLSLGPRRELRSSSGRQSTETPSTQQ